MAKTTQEPLVDQTEPVWLDGPRARHFELFFALRVFWEFIRGFRGLHFVLLCLAPPDSKKGIRITKRRGASVVV
jgi:hypothetical protein